MEREPSFEKTKKGEKLQGEATWPAGELRHYLRALAYNTPEKNFCLEKDKFPQQIVLSHAWHEIFNRMRAATAEDAHERWAMIGVNTDRDRLYVSRDFVRAQKPRSDIDAESMLNKVVAAFNRQIPHLVGDIHSHPQFGFRLLEKWLGQDCFSLRDFYSFLYPSEYAPSFGAMFLVGPNENRVVFRSRETELLPSAFDEQLFESIWQNRDLFTIRPNIAIARRYRLVLYGGKPGQTLMRLFP